MGLHRCRESQRRPFWWVVARQIPRSPKIPQSWQRAIAPVYAAKDIIRLGRKMRRRQPFFGCVPFRSGSRSWRERWSLRAPTVHRRMRTVYAWRRETDIVGHGGSMEAGFWGALLLLLLLRWRERGLAWRFPIVRFIRGCIV